MRDYVEAINGHYGLPGLNGNILEALRLTGKDVDALTRDDLASFDEFHPGGREATRGLAVFAGVCPGMHVLDVGSGVGGPARTLAAEFGCRVTGLDLTADFCRAAEMLTTRVGLSDQITFRHGNALEMPFDDNLFDVVWTQNTLMNIENKERLFREMCRVLRPGGRLALAAIMAGPTPGAHYPTFWAGDAALSFLSAPEVCRRLLQDSGFTEIAWEDITAKMIEISRARLAAAAGPAPPPLGRQVIVAADVPEKMINNHRNFAQRCIVAIRALFERH